jgi:hypothetical protein
MQKQVRRLAEDAAIATSDNQREEVGPNIRQESEAKVLGFIVQHPPKLNALAGCGKSRHRRALIEVSRAVALELAVR